MIVRAAAHLHVTFGRVDEDGDVVNLTPVVFHLGKLCHEEFERVLAEVGAQQADLGRRVAALLAAHEAATAADVAASEAEVLEGLEAEEAAADADNTDSLSG